MLQTVEAEMDSDGNIRLLEPLSVASPHRVLVTLLEPSVRPTNGTDISALVAVVSTDAARETRRQQQMAWLRANAKEHGGQYVALVGGLLIATGKTFRAAHQSAVAAGQQEAFVTYLPRPDEALEMGGWA